MTDLTPCIYVATGNEDCYQVHRYPNAQVMRYGELLLLYRNVETPGEPVVQQTIAEYQDWRFWTREPTKDWIFPPVEE